MGAFYSNSIANFIDEDNSSIIGELASKSGLSGFYQLLHTQTLSWNEEIRILKEALAYARSKNARFGSFGILLEYPIARREKRIDVVIIAHSIIVVIKFKVGRSEYLNADKEQLLDYCLDLRDFHFESKSKTIIPILLATNAKKTETGSIENSDFVKEISLSNPSSLADDLLSILDKYNDTTQNIDFERWNNSDYSPTPTIIEAAQTLYAGKSVVEISRSHAGKINLTRTSNAVVEAIKTAKSSNEKIICFITGVPGAGKTLAGLNIAHYKEFQSQEGSIATFLSGNMPLIKVLREALSRDAFKKIKNKDASARKKETDRIISFIENVHRFLDPYFTDKTKIPNNKIVIFDEAQRAWNADHSMRKFQRPYSEAEMMLEIMNRHEGWAAIVALVGGGQEINTGEAGLPEWGKVIKEKYSNWKVYISPQLAVGDHSTGDLALFKKMPENLSIIENKALHLDVAIRSYKAEELSKWVNLVLTNQTEEAKETLQDKLSNYELVLTRDLGIAKKWLRSHCRGSRRMGLVSSSGARRLRPYGLEVKIEFEEAEWFLNAPDDIRSSNFLEIPATEFKIQGLELDWAGVCWDADLRKIDIGWDFNVFKGTKWQKVKDIEMQKFIINKYRVLLTRARQGMIIFIPLGDKNDPTRNPQFYNNVANYLISIGVTEL